MPKEVIIIGLGGHGRVIADIIEKSGDNVYGFLDDDVEGYNTVPKFLGAVEKCTEYKDKYFIIAIGNNSIRKKIAERYNCIKYYTAIHPTAVIAGDVSVEEGSCVMANAVINASTVVGRHTIINTAAVVEHDNKIGDYVHISPGAILCGTVHIGRGTHIGAGAVVRNNISICEKCIVGVGTAVVKNIDQSGVYIGTPAQLLKNRGDR